MSPVSPASQNVNVELPAPSFVLTHFPGLAQAQFLSVAAWQWLSLAIALAVSAGLAALLSRITVLLLERAGGRPHAAWASALARSVERPLSVLLALVAFEAAVDWIDLVGRVGVGVEVAIRQAFIGASAWLTIVTSGALVEALEQRLSGTDEFLNRGSRTQLLLAQRVFGALVVVVAIAAALSSFKEVRNLGVSLLASAGIASVVLGFAAQKTLGTLLAGIQLSISQPIRLGDTVIFETEYGTVEEIRLTYVVLRLWDRRRMIAPVTRFLEAPFQNWTKVLTNLLGSVEVWTDYRMPLEPLREKVADICKRSKLWDGEVAGVQVTDLSERAVKVRVLVSAANASDLFDLRCEVREKLVAFLQALEGGRYLPVVRNLNFDDPPPAA